MIVSQAVNEFLNKNLDGVVKDGLDMSDELLAATFVIPELDFSSLAESLFEEACFLIQTRRRRLYADIFIGELCKRGWKDEVGVYFQCRNGKYRVNSAIVQGAHLNHIEKPWFASHPGEGWWGLIKFVSDEISQPVRSGLLAAALTKDYESKRIVQVQLPWQEQGNDSTVNYGSTSEYAAGLLTKALRLFS